MTTNAEASLASGPTTWPRDPHAVDAMLRRPLQIVAGKGGVGRTSVACALALGSAKRGDNTLLVEVNAPDSAAHALGVPASHDTPKEVLPRLWLCRVTPQGALREYALLVLRFRAVYNLVFENRLVRYLLRAILSLSELTMAGKITYHALEKQPDGRPVYDRIVVDAPATGHAVTLLSVARVIADTVPRGTMRNVAEGMAGVFEDPMRSCMHVVTLPEELPVSEGIDLVNMVPTKLNIPLGLGFINRMRAPILGRDGVRILEMLTNLGDEALVPYTAALSRRLLVEAREAAQASHFIESSGRLCVVLPELPLDQRGRARIEQLNDVIEDARRG